MADLLCALCLLDTRPLRAQPAITIANGHALCEGHFVRTAQQVNSTGGGVALSFLTDPRMGTA